MNVSSKEETIWLTQKDLTVLFGVDKSRISRHIKNILEEGELDSSVVAESATTGTDRKTYTTRYSCFLCRIISYFLHGITTPLYYSLIFFQTDPYFYAKLTRFCY